MISQVTIDGNGTANFEVREKTPAEHETYRRYIIPTAFPAAGNYLVKFVVKGVSVSVGPDGKASETPFEDEIPPNPNPPGEISQLLELELAFSWGTLYTRIDEITAHFRELSGLILRSASSGKILRGADGKILRDE